MPLYAVDCQVQSPHLLVAHRELPLSQGVEPGRISDVEGGPRGAPLRSALLAQSHCAEDVAEGEAGAPVEPDDVEVQDAHLSDSVGVHVCAADVAARAEPEGEAEDVLHAGVPAERDNEPDIRAE